MKSSLCIAFTDTSTTAKVISAHSTMLGTSMDPATNQNMQVNLSSHSIVPGTSMDPANSSNVQANISIESGTSMDPANSADVPAEFFLSLHCARNQYGSR